MGTSGFQIEGKEGDWLAFDNIIIDGKQFFLMEHESYRKDGSWVVVDEDGKLIVDRVYHGFDQAVLQQIRDYLNPPQTIIEPVKQEAPSGYTFMPFGNNKEKPSLENWQKYMENGEYLRSSEIDEEQNYKMIDGRRNNMPLKGKKCRVSVLKKLHQKQAEIVKRSRKPSPQMEVSEDMERRRK